MRTPHIQQPRKLHKALLVSLSAGLPLLLHRLVPRVRSRSSPRPPTLTASPARLPFPSVELEEMPSGPPESITPVSLTLDLTHHCPFRCPGCIEAGPMRGSHRGELSTATALKIIDRFVDQGGRDLLLYGGEPTYHPQFDRVVMHAAACGLNLRLITNGSQLASPRVYRALTTAATRSNVAVRVSLNAGTARTHAKLHGTPSRFARVVCGMNTLRGTGVGVQVSFLLQEANAGEIREAYRIAAEAGATALLVRGMTGQHGIGPVFLSPGARATVLDAVADLIARAGGPALHIEGWHLELLATGTPPDTTKPYASCYYCGAARLVITPPEPGVAWACPYWRATRAFHVADLESAPLFSDEFEKLRREAVQRIDPRRHCRGVICNRDAANRRIHAAQSACIQLARPGRPGKV